MSTDSTSPSQDNAASKWTLLAGGLVILAILTFVGAWVWEQVERPKNRQRGHVKGRATPSFMERKYLGMATQQGLRRLGQLYLRVVQKGSPPQSPKDLKAVEASDDEDVDYLNSSRSEEPFVIIWGVNPAQLPEGGANTLLAWEASADGLGGRFVQMADCRTSTYLSAEQFQNMPKATPAAAQSPTKRPCE